MYKMKAAIQQKGDQWLLGFNVIDYEGNGKAKRVSSLLPYIHTFIGRKEAYENLKVILNNRCKCIVDLTGKKFERVGEGIRDGIEFYEWKEIEE